jgi:phosphate transport system substrate-binding protein
MMTPRFFCGLFVLVMMLVTGCRNKDKKGNYLDSPTFGEISISVDESLYQVIEAEIPTFQALYPGTKINAHYLPENFAIEELMNDSARLAILTRTLTEEELKYFEQENLKITNVQVASDAIALIVNRNNPDTLITYDQLKGIMSGQVQNWNQLNGKSTLSGIKVVFDNSNSSTVRFMKDSVAQVAQLPSYCFAVDSNPKVIDYVSTHEEAIGLIGVGWISDTDDSLTRSFLDKVKVVSISNPQSKNKERVEFYQPFQAEIKLKQYPLYRDVYVVSRENRNGLGNGFTSFIASERGQRIIQKAGLLPFTMPTRIIQLGDDSRIKREMQEE